MKGVKRGCGTREQGGAYLEVPLSRNGKPVEHFLIDPPHPLDADALGMSPIGVKLIDDLEGRRTPDGKPLQHVVDWVGAQHYPNVADMVEEIRRFGLSRRIARTKDFARLGPGSRILLAHAHAIIEPDFVRDAYYLRGHACPKRLDDHTTETIAGRMCAGLWWEDVVGISSAPDPTPDRSGRVIRSMPSFSYDCRCRPPRIEPRYQLGLFASFPIAQIAVIRADDGSHEVTEHIVRQSLLPVVVEDE